LTGVLGVLTGEKNCSEAEPSAHLVTSSERRAGEGIGTSSVRLQGPMTTTEKLEGVVFLHMR